MKGNDREESSANQELKEQHLLHRIAAVVIALVLLMSLLTGYILVQLEGVTYESRELDGAIIPLQQIILEVQEDQSAQQTLLEESYSLGLGTGEDSGQDTIIAQNTLHFNELGLQVDENLRNGIEIVGWARALSESSASDFSVINDLLIELHQKHLEFQLEGSDLLNLIQNDQGDEAQTVYQDITLKAGHIDQQMASILLQLQVSGSKVEQDIQSSESDSIRMTGLVVVAEAVIAISFGIYMAYFLSKSLNNRPAPVLKPLTGDALAPFQEEKKVLVKEIHHRVKNNLQIISSLLYLQSEYIDDKKSQKVFQESQNRVRSMALVHDNVYQSRELSRVNFPVYIEKLANYLYRSYNINQEVITLSIDVDDVYMTPDTAIPCGLIINELMLNSLKHAFPVAAAGEIRIAFRALPDDRLMLTFADNGVDFSRELDPSNSKSLGLKLVNMLTRQLQGTMEFDKSQGNMFRIIFPADQKPRQGS